MFGVFLRLAFGDEDGCGPGFSVVEGDAQGELVSSFGIRRIRECQDVFPFLSPDRQDTALTNRIGQLGIKIGFRPGFTAIWADADDALANIAPLVSDIHHQSTA